MDGTVTMSLRDYEGLKRYENLLLQRKMRLSKTFLVEEGTQKICINKKKIWAFLADEFFEDYDWNENFIEWVDE